MCRFCINFCFKQLFTGRRFSRLGLAVATIYRQIFRQALIWGYFQKPTIGSLSLRRKPPAREDSKHTPESELP